MSDLQERLQQAISNSCRIERALGGGGMSSVFLAVETELNRRVVITVLAPELTNELMTARFRREMEVTALLQHPHILPVLTTGAKDGQPHPGRALECAGVRPGERPRAPRLQAREHPARQRPRGAGRLRHLRCADRPGRRGRRRAPHRCRDIDGNAGYMPPARRLRPTRRRSDLLGNGADRPNR